MFQADTLSESSLRSILALNFLFSSPQINGETSHVFLSFKAYELLICYSL